MSTIFFCRGFGVRRFVSEKGVACVCVLGMLEADGCA